MNIKGVQMNIISNYQLQSFKFNQKFNYKQNTKNMNNPSFQANKDLKAIEKKVFSNPETKKVIEKAMNDMKFNSSTIQNTKQKLEEILGCKINNLDVVELLLAGINKY